MWMCMCTCVAPNKDLIHKASRSIDYCSINI